MESEIIPGALPSSEASDDWVFEHMVRGSDGIFYKELPSEYTLYEHLKDVRKQGNRGTCGAIVAATLQEINMSINVKKKLPIGAPSDLEYMSPEFIYFHRVNKPGEGMFGKNVFQILQKIGTVPETLYAYGEKNPPNSNMYLTASKFRITNYAKIKTIDGLKQALLELGPCYMGLPLYNFSERFWDPTYGKVVNGGHAVCVIGYTKDGFIFRNSWGNDWGDKGNCIFNYGDFGIHWEIWVPITNNNQVFHNMVTNNKVRRHSVI